VSLARTQSQSRIPHCYDCRCPEHAAFQLRLLEFHDGSPHPLASRPSVDISLPTKETHYIALETHMSIMGSYFVIAAGLPPEGTGKDILLLVDWQKGHITTVSEMPDSRWIIWLMLVPSFTTRSHESISRISSSCLMTSWPSFEDPRTPSNFVELILPSRRRLCKPFAFCNSLPSCHTHDSPRPP
jgi:hypothetical protein